MDIGIIGGADGPTSIYITGGFPWIIVLVFTIAVCMIFLVLRRRRHKDGKK